MDWLDEKSKNSNKLFNFMGELWKRYGKENQTLSQESIFNTFAEMFGNERKDKWYQFLSNTNPLPLKEMFINKGWKFIDEYKPALDLHFYENDLFIYFHRYGLGIDKTEIEHIGLERGDILKEINGQSVTCLNEYFDSISELPMEGHAALKVIRGDKIKIINAPIRQYRKIINIEPPTKFETLIKKNITIRRKNYSICKSF